ncbi:MAG: alternative ribosome rescue aminoacyl-tRNA hydrolase ArfB [Crocinitomicaceae bacterium]
MLKSELIKEIVYKAVRSSGPGGQHANKVSSKVILQFDLINSEVLTEFQKSKLKKYFSGKISLDGIIQLTSDDNRSQHRNKKIVTDRFFEMLTEAFKVEKVRKKSKPSWSSIQKVKEAKKKLSEKKTWRKKPRLD